MTYELAFHRKAIKEWEALDASIKRQFKSKIQERLINPRIEGDRLRGIPDSYKIKLQSVGYRLVYQVKDDKLIVTVLAIGKRERGKVYDTAMARHKIHSR